MEQILTRLRSRTFWKNALERAFSSAWQNVAALGLVMPATLVDVDWFTVGGVGLAAALASILWSLVSIPSMDAGLPWWQAIAYRAGKTFAVSLIAVLSAAQVNAFTIDWPQTLSVAAVAAVVSVAKNYLAPPLEVESTIEAFSYTSSVSDLPMIQITETSPAGVVETHVPQKGAAEAIGASTTVPRGSMRINPVTPVT